MFPEYFHGMKAEEKKSMMGIMEKHNNKWFSLDFVMYIHSSLSIPLSEIQSLCVYVTLCNKHPQIIDM